MKHQASRITIYRHGDEYRCDVQGHFGREYRGALAGRTPREAAKFAAKEYGRYIANNPLGGILGMPREVEAELEKLDLYYAKEGKKKRETPADKSAGFQDAIL